MKRRFYIVEGGWERFCSSIKEGEIVSGRVIETFPDGRALVLMRGFCVVAESEKNLKPGRIKALVKDKGDKVVLQLLDGEEDDMELAGLLKEFNLIADLYNLAALRLIILNDETMSREHIMEVAENLRERMGEDAGINIIV